MLGGFYSGRNQRGGREAPRHTTRRFQQAVITLLQPVSIERALRARYSCNRVRIGGRIVSRGRHAPAARCPKGSRNKLSEEFLAALCSDWEQHGPSVLVQVREANPTAYLRVIASVVPARIEVEPGSEFDHMSDDELRALLLKEIAELGLAGG
jgi:hypothetical protein